MKRTPQMSPAHQLKSRPSRRLKTSLASSKTMSAAVNCFLSTSKRAAQESLALDSLPDQTLHLLFHSMTIAQRVEAIGLLRSLNDSAGSLYVRCLRIRRYANSSRMDCMISPSSSDPTESE